jgi:adenylosuccinate lyase
VHEALRKHAVTSARRVKEQGLPNDLVERMKSEPLLYGVDIDEMLNAQAYVGRAPQQVRRFLEHEVASIRKGYGTRFGALPSSEPKV